MSTRSTAAIIADVLHRRLGEALTATGSGPRIAAMVSLHSDPPAGVALAPMIHTQIIGIQITGPALA